MRIKKKIALARFRLSPGVAAAQAVLAEPGALNSSFALGLLTLMANRKEPGLLFWPMALSETLSRSKFTPRQGKRAVALFFQWLEGAPKMGVKLSLDKAYNKADADEIFQVGGRRRAWGMAIRLAQELAVAGAAPSDEEFDSGKGYYGSELCMAVFERVQAPEALAQRLEAEWEERSGRRWGMAIAALPWAWLADLIERLPRAQEAPVDYFNAMLAFGVAARAGAEGRLDEAAARILRALGATPDFMALRLSVPSSSTCLWESVDAPPALEELAMDFGRHWGWAGALSVIRGSIEMQSSQARLARRCLAHQMDVTDWEGAIKRLRLALGPPPKAEVDKLIGSPAGACLERALLESAVPSTPRESRAPRARRV